MKNFVKKIFLVFLTVVFGIILPHLVWAASMYISVPAGKIYEGDTFTADLKISSPAKLINVADGTITFDNNLLEVKEISTGGSIFSVWPEDPSFSNDNGLLSFSGGTPQGFEGTGGEVFKIVFLAAKTGTAKITPEKYSEVLLADGKGTKDDLTVSGATITILPRPLGQAVRDSWSGIISSDQTPPENFQMYISKSPQVFDNKYFISFSTTDKESGIDHYEVKEGKKDFVVAQSPYLLQDQSLSGDISVKAVDKAGNERIVKIIPRRTGISWAIFAIIIIIVLIISIFLWLKLKKIKAAKKIDG